MFRSRAVKAAITVLAGALLCSQQATAACTKLAFSVNDYGKDGPTKDAKNLLDKYIAKWTADRNIKNYRTGPKEVTCELFLDFIVFDEYTCKAAANVCWDGPLPPGHTADSTGQAPLVNRAAQKSPPAAAKAAPISTGSVKAAPAQAAPAQAAPAQPAAARAPAAPAAQPAAPAAAPAAPASAPAAN